MMPEIYSFSTTQFLVLLKGAGYNKISGFDFKNEPLNDENVILSLHALSKSGVLSAVNDEFEVKADLKAMIDSIGTAKYFYTVRSRDNRLPDRCVFPGDKLLVCCIRPTDRNHITLCTKDPLALSDELSDEGYLPAGRSESLFCEDDLEDYEKELLSDTERHKALDISSRVVLSVDKVMGMEDSTPYLRIVDYYFYNYILYFDGAQKIREPYDDNAFKKYFERMMTE